MVPAAFVPKAGKSTTGRHNIQRKKVLDTYADAINSLSSTSVGLAKRNIDRLVANWNKCIWEVLDDEDITIQKSDPSIYFVDDTLGAKKTKPKVEEANAKFRNVSEMEHIVDGPGYDGKTIMIISSKTGRLVACRVGDEDKSHISKHTWATKHLHALIKAMNLQLNMARGARRKGVSSKYVCFGVRKEPKLTKLGAYATRQGIARKQIKKLNQMIANLVKDIELYALNYIPGFDLATLQKLRVEANLPMLNNKNGKCMQMAIGQRYWSPMHIDDDIWYTILSGYSQSTMNKKDGDKTILFYFIFPSLNLAIPMRSMDFLVFNSSFPHCASNYRIDDTFIFSCFSASKATHTHMADNDDQKEKDSGNLEDIISEIVEV